MNNNLTVDFSSSKIKYHDKHNEKDWKRLKDLTDEVNGVLTSANMDSADRVADVPS